MKLSVSLLAGVASGTTTSSPTFKKLPEYKPENQQVWDLPAIPDDEFLESLTIGVDAGLQALHVMPGLIESFGGLEILQKQGATAMAQMKMPNEEAPRGDRARDGRC